MKLIRLFFKRAGLSLFMLLMAATGLLAQNPTYLCELRNDYQVDANTFEFDVYLLRTGSTVFEYSSMQFGININPTVKNGGTITVSLVPGSCEFNASQVPLANKFSFNGTKNAIIMTATPGPGAGNGTIISAVSPGTRVGRIRLVNTASFGIAHPDLAWCWTVAAGYPTKVNAYVAGLSVEITVQASHTTNNLVNPFLSKPVIVYNVTGTGNYCQGAPGLAVGLDGSEIGVTYTLIKNTVSTGITFDGTGAAFTFPGLQTFGTYTVTAARNATYITGTMAGDAKVTEDPLLTVSVSIAANPPSPVCDGTSVTFTAIPVNGGTPTYQWYKNTVAVGTGSTYSYVPVNGDQVYVIMTSSLTGCVTGSPATSSTLTMTVNPIPHVTTAPLTESICSGSATNIVLTADVIGTTFSWTTTSSSPTLSGFSNGTGNLINQIIINSGVTIETVTYHITPTSNGCAGPVTDYTVTVNPVPYMTNVPLNKTICNGNNTNIFLTSNVAGTLFTWTATGSSLQVTGYSDNSIPTTIINQTLINSGFAIETVTYHITPNANSCIGPVTDYVVTVFPTADAYFVPSSQTICAGQTTNIDIFSHVAGSSYTWTASASSPLVTGFSGGSGSNISQTISSTSTLSETVTYVITPVANGCAGTNSMFVVTVNPLLPVSVSIDANPAGPVCAGTSVTFTATPVNGGTPAYQWVVNGVNVGGGLATYSYVPVNGDQVSVVMATSLSGCVTGSPATSNIIPMTVNPNLPVSVSIVANPAGPVCAGTSVTFTATPVNGGTPAYQWVVNGVNVGGGLSTYSYAPVNGDQVSVVMATSLTGCVTGSPATSNIIPMTVDPLIPVSVSIVADVNNICAGTPVTFTATPVNGGTPTYQWYLNGGIVGAGLSTYSLTPANGDQVYVVMTSSLVTCVTGSPATSNTVTMTVNPLLPVSVSIVANPAGPICDGTSVTFTATPVNGGTPAYQWVVNGVNVGGGLATYSYVPVNSDQVSVVMTTSLTGCVTGSPATSNIIPMTVNPVIPVSVSIVANPVGPVCAGTSVTFTATPVNGGVPAYQWMVNGVNVGGGLDTYTYTPVNGDQVKVVLTSSLSTCVTGSPATSNIIPMTVNPLIPASVTIAASENPVCSFSPVTFTATPVNGGTPTYQWFVNSALQPGTLSTFTYTPADGDEVYAVMLSSLVTCITGNPATSNTIVMGVSAALPASVSIVSTGTCAGFYTDFTATPANGGTPTYEWYVNAILQAGEILPVFSYAPAGGDQVYVVMTSSLGCATGSPATSNTITINPQTPVSVSIVEDQNNVNSGTPVTFTATPTNGGGTPFYVWYVNWVAQAGQTAATFTYVPANGDIVACGLYSDVLCPSGYPVLSNVVTMNVIASLIPVLTGPESVCDGASAIYTTDPGMTNYVWTLPLGGGTFVTGPGPNQITVTWTAAGNWSVNVSYDGAIAGGTTLNVTVHPLLPVSVSIVADANPVCAGTTVTFTAIPVNGGTPAYQWYLNGAMVGAGLNTYTYVPLNGDAIYVVLTSDEVCQSGGPAASNTINMIVNPDATIALTSAAGTDAQSLCINTAITPITYTIGGGGTGAGVTGLPAGVTGAYAAGTFTISGSPTVTGTFNYTVTTTGTCVQTTATGTIMVNPDATITLTSAAGTNAQSLCINTAITPITYAIGGGGTGAGVTGLPAGVTGSYAAGVFTISGTPSASGTFNYTVTTTGTCVQAIATGTINVNPTPIPTISGPATVCESPAIYNYYYTQPGQFNYQWTFSPGAFNILGGGPTDDFIALILNVPGPQWVAVNYNDANGCTAPAPFVFNITVNPNATITLTSGAGTDAQSLCINSPLTPITYAIGGGGTGAGVTGLPTGVTGAYAAGVFTISGTPSVTGIYNYTVTTTGTCAQVTVTGTITVNPDATLTLTSAAGTDAQSLCINTPLTNITYAIGGGGTGAGVTGLPTGVTGSYAAGVFTISGTPTVSGTFNYTVTTTGTCIQATATGTITVNPDATITLTSAAGTNAQSLCINTPITAITYAIGGGGTGAGVTGLPAGVTGAYAAGVFTISGSPSVTGTFNYTITTTGTCIQTTATGTITVNPDATITLTSAPGTNVQSLCINTAITPITYTIGGGGTGAGVTGLPTGVTGSYAAGVFTISGTPTTSGIFNYTVTTTGTCVQVTATGTITVNPDATITLTSGAGTNAQSLCINTAITNITYAISGGGTGAGVTGLPAGVTGVYNAGVFTISGSPSVTGTFNYTVTTTGTCVQATATGTITVNPNAAIVLTSAAGTNVQSLCINTAITNITYAISGGGTGAGVTGLPAGVTGVYNAGVFTISGTPSVSGTFNYTVTTTGTCVQATATGTITVNPNASIVLTSAAGTNAQSLCINTAITNITYAISGGGTGAGVTGLPAGVTGAYSAGVFTISGSPSVTGTFNYTVTTTGTCVQTTATGTITVNPNAAIVLTSAAGTNAQSPCINTAITNITYAISGGGTGAGVTGLPTGVTGVYSAGVFTISGTPTVSGLFTYTVTTTGTCLQATATGTINVKANATITLTSAAGTNAQTLCINTAITNITYAIGGSGTGAGVTGLPAGVTGVYNAGVFTISGSPSVTGTFNYTVTTTGTCVQASATGTITVNPNAAIVLTSAAGTNAQSLCVNTVLTNITYAISGGGTGAGVTGLPAGVTGVYSAGVFTISGTPTASGTFNYIVTTTGTCAQATATGTITVNLVPVPTITGYTSMCVNIGPLDYITESGKTGYVWTVSPGNTIAGGQNTNQVQVNWLVSGVQWVAVTYTNPSGCAAASPTQLPVFVNPLPGPAGTITGTAAVCGGTNGVAYSVGIIANASSYVWTLPAGASIATGFGTNSITVNFDPFASSGDITVYGNNTCGNGAVSPAFAVTVTPLPATAGIITGPTAVCQGVTGVVYTVPPIANATDYVWTVPTGASIVGGGNTNSITVDYSLIAVSGTVTVHGTNSCGNGLAGPELQVTVNPIPPTPIITIVGGVLHSNVPTGNLWYFEGAPAPAPNTGQDYTPTEPGFYWCVVTENGCSSDTSNHIYAFPVGIETDPASANFVIYPVPNDGRFTVSITSSTFENDNIKVYNTLGVMIYEIRNVEVNGTAARTIDLRPTPSGVYSVVIENGNYRSIRKILINR